MEKPLGIAWDTMDDKALMKRLWELSDHVLFMLEQSYNRWEIRGAARNLRNGIEEMRSRGCQVGLFELDRYLPPPTSGVEPIGRGE